MKTYTHRVKYYVVIAILMIVVLVHYGSSIVDQKIFYTPDTLVRMIKSLVYSYEFAHRTRTASASWEPSDKLDYNASVPVIVYHGIPYSDEPNQFSITVDNFKHQMFALKNAGYNTISTEDLYQFFQGAPLPEKPILITFDDGRIDAVRFADPILRALDYQATMFVIGRYSFQNERQDYYISTDMIREMDASGRWDIQSHSYDGHNVYPTAPDQLDGHFFSHKQWLSSLGRMETDDEFRERIATDLAHIQDSLVGLLEKPIRSFAFPYGDFGQNDSNFMGARDINIEEGKKVYAMQFYQSDQHQRYRNNYYNQETATEPYYLVKRFDVDSSWEGSDLLDVLDRSAAKKLPYNDDFVTDHGWLRLWGDITIGSGHLTIQAEPDSSGGTILLDGSRLWKDYSVMATVNVPPKSSVYIWARFINDDNNAACNFSNGFIHIEETVDGESNIIQGKISSDLDLPDGDFTVETRVQGRHIQCILDGTHVVESNFLHEKLTSGGVGFKTWERTPGSAHMIMTGLTISEI